MADFDYPQSRNEALLQNMLGADNPIPEPESRNEAILYAIVNELDNIPEPYEAPPRSRIESLLVELYENSGGENIGIEISSTSDTPIFFGIDDTGFYVCSTAEEKTPVALGRTGELIYAESV